MKLSLLVLCLFCIFLATACTKKPRTAQPNPCPQTFVAKPFAKLTLTDELRNTQNNLSFAKVQALCKQDKQQTTLLKLSFTLQLDKPLSDKQSKTTLLIPLFAALTQDGKSLASRQSRRLQTTFDKKGRAKTSWLVALPPTLSAQATSPTLYLGFEGDNIPLQELRAQP